MHMQVALYARVSSEQQAQQQTITSQLAALKERIASDGLSIAEELQFIDEGYSGAHLVRPALERLRDMSAAGYIDRVYIHSPDRLARKYAYQVLLVEEFNRTGVEVHFLNHELETTPEGSLLLQMQGMIAEYERAKIMERSRRGKRHAARSGSVSVLGGGPYGYRYIDKHSGGGQASLEINEAEAQIVRQIFSWVGKERFSIGEVCRRLKRLGVATRSGKESWDRATIWGILKNPAYKGSAAFGKTRNGPMKLRVRPQRHSCEHPRRAYSTYAVPQEEWIYIPVPALIEEALFEEVQEQLQENRKRARSGKRGVKYLLQGLLVCSVCQYAYYGKALSGKAAKGKVRPYAYYRCIGSDAYRFGGERICSNKQVRTDMLEQLVWEEIQKLLENPRRLEVEYQRRLIQLKNLPGQQERLSLEKQMEKLRRGISRLIDSYAEGYLDKGEFEPRVQKMKQRLKLLEEQHNHILQQQSLKADLQFIIGRLDEFAKQVKRGLEEADWFTKREIIRSLVKRVEIGKEEVKVVFRVDPGREIDPQLGAGGGNGKSLQHCWRRHN